MPSKNKAAGPLGQRPLPRVDAVKSKCMGTLVLAHLAHISFQQVVIPETSFSPHDIHDVNNLTLCAIEDTNWWNDKLAILRAFELGRH